MTAGAAELSEFAPAKVNLTLRIGRKRLDGYHQLESLVVFADVGDNLRLVPGPALALSVDGATAEAAGPLDDNLVLKAARALQSALPNMQSGHFHLSKTLPVAAGIGGGSSDAAAALRLLARVNRLPVTDARVTAAARATGADVPVCLDPKPRIMRGLGEILSGPYVLPPLHAVLVNAGIPVPTAAVFAALARQRAAGEPASIDHDPASLLIEGGDEPTFDPLIDAITKSKNDLEAPALAQFPAVGTALDALRAIAACRLARMSGSGGTCFGLFDTAGDAAEAAALLARSHPRWWTHATTLSPPVTSA